MTQKLGTNFGTEKWNRKWHQKTRTEHDIVQYSDCALLKKTVDFFHTIIYEFDGTHLIRIFGL